MHVTLYALTTDGEEVLIGERLTDEQACDLEDWAKENDMVWGTRREEFWESYNVLIPKEEQEAAAKRVEEKRRARRILRSAGLDLEVK